MYKCLENIEDPLLGEICRLRKDASVLQHLEQCILSGRIGHNHLYLMTTSANCPNWKRIYILYIIMHIIKKKGNKRKTKWPWFSTEISFYCCDSDGIRVNSSSAITTWSLFLSCRY